jgi:hypothetical protein
MASEIDVLLRTLAARYADHASVLAVAHAGSRMAGVADQYSDVDIYVYDQRGEVPLEVRRAIAGALADQAQRVEVGCTTWEPGDEWIDRATGIKVDTMFRSPRWIEDQLDQVLVRHQASLGYTTCFWFNVLNAEVLTERDGWYTALRQRADVPYPDGLMHAIVAKNHHLLRDSHSAYYNQIELAMRRRDRNSLNHRLAVLLASYFDVLFAINKQPHPGEKRLVTHVERRCARRPRDLGAQIDRLVASLSAPWEQMDVLAAIHDLVDELDGLVRAEGLPVH